MTLRVFLTGKVSVEHDGRVVSDDGFPGLQGRIVFAMLAAEREQPRSTDQLMEELWSEHPPQASGPALRAVISKLRRALRGVGLDRNALAAEFGTYRLHLPPDAWVDLEAAADSLHRAETLSRAGELEPACGWALAARAIAGRSFLPGADGPWVARQRTRLRDVHLRSLEALAHVWIGRGEPSLAIADAEEALRLEPFRESMYRALMTAHTAAGNRAEALRVYQRCRDLLCEELGSDPSPQTEAVYLQILRAG